VALKFLTASFAGDAERLARFEREAKLLATLNHANIATLHGFEEAAGERFLVLELVGGESLDERLQRGPLSVDEVLAIGRQVAEALDAAHEAGIVHRDLKPANIRITDEKVVKVLDFGLAKVWEPDAVSGDPAASPTLTHQMTQAGVILGTAAYMSPEQARGRPTDKRTDIWSFGVVLHELLSGRTVFAGDTVSDTIASVLKSAPDDAALPAATPPRLRELLARCLEKDPRRRLRDIGDARVELEKVEAGDAGVAATTSSTPRSRWFTLAAVLVLGLVLGALLQGWRMGEGTAGTEPAGVKRLSVLPPKGLTVRWFNFSHDGQTLVYAAGAPAAEGDDVRLYQRRLDSFDSTPIPESDNPMWAAFSPDSGRVAFQTDNGDGSYSIKKMSLAGGPVVELLVLSDSPGGTGADWWSEDELLVVIDNRRTLARLSANGGAPTPVLILDNPGPISLWGGVHVLPGGGTLLLYLLEDSSEGILFRTESLDLETNERRTILADGWLRPYRDAATVYRKGTAFAVPFDRDRLEITGSEIPLWDDRWSLTRGDSLAYVPKRTEPDRLVLVDRSGGIEPLVESPDQRLVDLGRSPDGRQIALLTYDPTRVRRNLWRFDVGCIPCLPRTHGRARSRGRRRATVFCSR
jgi:serine/threonine-protein kinase